MNNNQFNNNNQNMNRRSTTPNQRGSIPNGGTPSNFNNQVNNNMGVPMNGGFNPQINTPESIQTGSSLNNQPVRKENTIPNRVQTPNTTAPQGSRRNIPSINNKQNDLNSNKQPSKISNNKDNVPNALKNKNPIRNLTRPFTPNFASPKNSEKTNGSNESKENNEPFSDSTSSDDLNDNQEEFDTASLGDSLGGAVSTIRKVLFWIKALPVIAITALVIIIIILVVTVFTNPIAIAETFVGLNSSSSQNPVYVFSGNDPAKQKKEAAYYEKINSTVSDYLSKYGVSLDKYLLNATLLYRYFTNANSSENTEDANINFDVATSNVEAVAELMISGTDGNYTTDFKEKGLFYNNLLSSSFLTSYYKDFLKDNNSAEAKEKLVQDIFDFAETARELLEKNTRQAFLGDSMRIFLQTCQQKYSTYTNERGKTVFSNDRNINAGTNYPEYFSLTEYLKGAVEGEIGRSSLNDAEREGVKAFTVATLTYMLGSFYVDFYPGVQDINFPSGNCRLVSCDVTNGCTYANRGDQYGTAYSGLNRFGISSGNHRPWNEAQNKFMDEVLSEIYGVVMVQPGVTPETFTSGTQLKGGNYYDKKSNPNCGDNCMGQEDALADSRNGMTYEQILHKYYTNFDIINIREGLYYETTNNYNGQVNLNENYHYHQGDYSSPNSFCEGGTIAASGCSVASTAIAVSLLTNQRITPLDISNKLKATGKCTGNGTRQTYPISAAAEYGLSAYSVNKNDTTMINKMLSDLASGHTVVVARIAPNSSSRYSTSSGHYIALVGVKTEGGRTKVLVWDPATRSKSRDNYWADFETDIVKWANNPAFMVLSNN